MAVDTYPGFLGPPERTLPPHLPLWAAAGGWAWDGQGALRFAPAGRRPPSLREIAGHVGGGVWGELWGFGENF